MDPFLEPSCGSGKVAAHRGRPEVEGGRKLPAALGVAPVAVALALVVVPNNLKGLVGKAFVVD